MKYKYLLATIGFILLISIPGTMLYVYGADPWDPEYLPGIDEQTSAEYYVWEPKEDITVYELALIMPIFSYVGKSSVVYIIENLPPKAKRHFRKEE